MNKTAIKNFAVRARRKLIEDITQKVYELGITENGIKEIETFEGGFMVHGVVNGKIYKKYEIKQREKLIEKINRSGYDHVVEEVAYTWFNRFIALRFMEVNEYLPTGIRILSSKETGKTEPDIIKEALNVELDVDKDLVYKLIDKNDTEDLYKYLLVKQCNELGKIMPMVFEEISDYTELLLPDNLLAEGSVIKDLVNSIEEEDYKDQVEIIGWMYQYYISEKKDEVFADLKKNKKITKENIPAATQLFTPKWIVKYMVENSLGRLWLESHPDEELKTQWKYYIDEAEQDQEVQKKLSSFKDYNLNPEDIKVLDPSMGSGHILVYAFDVLYDIYLKANYSERDIPQLILEKNLFGLDIDDRAGQLASFALMMKARSKNKRIFRRRMELHIYSIQESNGIPNEAIEYLISTKDAKIEKIIHKEDIKYLIEVFNNAKEYGSILDVKKIDFETIDRRIEEIRNDETIDLFEFQHREIILEKLTPLIKQAKIMSEKYDIVCTNPPYMGSKQGMNKDILKYVSEKYPDSKYDLYSVFIEKCIDFTKKDRMTAMITQHTWMFLSSYSNLRMKLLKKITIEDLLHLGPRAFEEISGEVVQTAALVFRNLIIEKYRGVYDRLIDYNAQEKELEFLIGKNRYKQTRQKDFLLAEGTPVVYWINSSILEVFESNPRLESICTMQNGPDTKGKNDEYFRYWYEVNQENVGLNNLEFNDRFTWFPLNKGGNTRWYGLNEYIVKKDFCNRNGNFFKSGISWSDLSSKFNCKFIPRGFAFNNHGKMCFVDNNKINYILGFLNSSVSNLFVHLFTVKTKYEIGYIGKIPFIYNDEKIEEIDRLVKENVAISKSDWDNSESSWDFTKHPLLNFSATENNLDINKIETAYCRWLNFTNMQFKKLKANEEILNRIFISIYSLSDEMTSEVEDKDITIRMADRERDIKSFISYAIGCIFGRYSLDEEGLINTGGEFDIDRYETIIPTKDNVLIIADDEYFEDDIVNRFVDFLKVTFGEENLEENLDYIAETLGQKTNETSRQTIRRYFLKGFYEDHVKTYQRRPIYWLFDSGKQNGFKALIYMHRYDSSTIARIRIDYLHKLQKKYEAELKRLDLLLESDLSPRDAAAARKRKENISKQIQECLAYDQVIAHVANQKIEIDLDDGVVVNYEKFQNVEVPQDEGKKPLKASLLAKMQ